MCSVIRVSHRYLLPKGVVLNASSSEATHFMEPKEAINLKNMKVRLSNSGATRERVILSMIASETCEYACIFSCGGQKRKEEDE